MVENEEIVSTDDQQHATEKKEKNLSRTKHKRNKSAGKCKPSKKDKNDRSDVGCSTNNNKDDSKSEFNIHVEIQDNCTESNSQDLHDQADSVDNLDEKDGTKRVEDLSSPTHVKAPSRQRKLFFGESRCRFKFVFF